MARTGRGFPQSTSYHRLSRVQPTHPVGGTASFAMDATGALTLVGSVIQAATVVQHRFRSVLVPPIADLAEVQRHLQRTHDEISRAVNPVRSIADGGTGLTEVTPGALVTGADAASLETIPIGTSGHVLTSDGAKPVWAAPTGGGGGEANTGSNVGASGVGPYDSKVGVDLRFRKINAASAKLTVVLNGQQIDLDVVVGTTATTVCVGNDARLSDARVPTLHASSHQNAGADEINVAGLSGVLADPQPPIIGAGATQAVAGNDARLTDSRAPNGAAAGVLSGTYPNPGFAVDMATQAELDAVAAAKAALVHTHPASDITTDLLMAQLPQIATDRLVGRDTAGTGDMEEIALTDSLRFDGAGGIELVGDVAVPGNTKLYGTNGAGVRGWYNQPAGGAGGASGVTEVDFGPFPGQSDARVTVAEASVLASSPVQAWLQPVATVDHSADEHLVETIKVLPGNIVNGVGFDICALNTSELFEALEHHTVRSPQNERLATQPTTGGRGTRIYGKWTVGWRL